MNEYGTIAKSLDELTKSIEEFGKASEQLNTATNEINQYIELHKKQTLDLNTISENSNKATKAAEFVLSGKFSEEIVKALASLKAMLNELNENVQNSSELSKAYKSFISEKDQAFNEWKSDLNYQSLKEDNECLIDSLGTIDERITKMRNETLKEVKDCISAQEKTISYMKEMLSDMDKKVDRIERVLIELIDKR